MGSVSAARSDADWAQIIAEAYAAETRPPLTEHLLTQIGGELANALAPVSDGESATGIVERANKALDAFEIALHAVVGPRVESLDEQAGVVVVKHRNEAGHPFRSFGGQ